MSTSTAPTITLTREQRDVLCCELWSDGDTWTFMVPRSDPENFRMYLAQSNVFRSLGWSPSPEAREGGETFTLTLDDGFLLLYEQTAENLRSLTDDMLDPAEVAEALAHGDDCREWWAFRELLDRLDETIGVSSVA